MRAYEIITEMFGSNVPVEEISTDIVQSMTDCVAAYRFKVGNDLEYIVYFWLEENDIYVCAFGEVLWYNDAGKAKIGFDPGEQGNQFKVYSAVKTAFLSFIRKHDPKIVAFKGYNGKQDTLYHRFLSIPKNIPTGYEFIVLGSEYGMALRKLEHHVPGAVTESKQTTPAQAFVLAFEKATKPHPTDRGARVVGGSKIAIRNYPPRDGDHRIFLDDISVDDFRKGSGSAGMRFLCGLADEHGIEIELLAKSFGEGGMTTPDLVKWYSGFGFNPTGWTGQGGSVEMRRQSS